MNADTLIQLLDLAPHPEGGWYGETWRGTQTPRASGSSIYFLLEANQRSHWHTVDAVEIWHWYAGGPLALHVHQAGRTRVELLGNDFAADQRPQRIVPEGAWQQAVPMDGWVLVGCTVSPGFQFEGFHLAEPGFEPEGNAG